jgi:hypothetical protein
MMDIETEYYQKREKAKKRVEEIKKFYTHVRVYVLINIVILLLRSRVLDFVLGKGEAFDPSFIDWVDLNMLLTPILWGIGLFIHGIYTFRYKFGFLKRWEDRQIRKIMEEEEEEQGRRYS